MLTVINHIHEEHQGIKLMLDILEKIVDKLEKGERVDQKHLEDILGFIEAFVEKVHHKKEEDVFYPALENISSPREIEIIEIDLGEHELSGRLTRGIDEFSRRFFSGDKEALKELIRYIREYIALTRGHASREDNVILPIVEKSIPKDIEEELAKKYPDEEIKRVGGKDDQYLIMLEGLKKIYLS